MNFLGHLYFSNNNSELMLNNLFGDFVKGKDISKYPFPIQEGIILHRKIDHFIDRHPKVLQLNRLLFEDLPKVSAIAVDIYFDHLLAKNWSHFHNTDFIIFLEQFYKSVNLSNEFYTEEFKQMISKMIEVNWISYYPLLEGLDIACNGVSKRISFENKLKEGKSVFLKFESEIEITFREFMLDTKQFF
jgi:acyl carrier protein phosphodiesterase